MIQPTKNFKPSKKSNDSEKHYSPIQNRKSQNSNQELIPS